MAKKKDTSLHVPAPYTKVPDGLWLSKEYKDLKDRTKYLYSVMLARWDPYQPGEAFSFPYDEINAITGYSSATISNGLKELLVNGYIKIPQKGRYPNNVSLYKIDVTQLQKEYPKTKRGKGTWPDYIHRLREGIE